MRDLCIKHLIVELMGKYSNIIFLDDNNKIIDSIKRINAGISSVREVLPGLDYFIPDTTGKKDPLTETEESFAETVCGLNMPVYKAVYSSYTGISPQAAEGLCHDCGIDSSFPACELSINEHIHLAHSFICMMNDVKSGRFSPSIIYDKESPIEYTVLPTSLYDGLNVSPCESVSSMLESYYSARNAAARIRQRSADLRQVVSNALDRNYKKYDLQSRQLKDTEKREKYRIYGELINTYGYDIPEGAASFNALNYYDNTTVTIPLDRDLSARENSVKYFAKYNKLKRTYEALSKLIVETKAEIDHLESIATSLDIATSYDDLVQIKEELTAYGYIRNKKTGKKGRPEHSHSKPLHYISSDGYDIYVGKNNIQNEELTFKFATGNDWWFHAKNMPGSHVIVKSKGTEMPDRVYEEAAALAAYYSRGRDQEKVEIDYIEKKHVKKVNGAAPGFVIYHTNYSMNIAPSDKLKKL